MEGGFGFTYFYAVVERTEIVIHVIATLIASDVCPFIVTERQYLRTMLFSRDVCPLIGPLYILDINAGFVQH